MFTAFPAHAQPTILHIWQGVHSIGAPWWFSAFFSLRCGLRLPRLTYIRSCSKNRHQWTDSESHEFWWCQVCRQWRHRRISMPIVTIKPASRWLWVFNVPEACANLLLVNIPWWRYQMETFSGLLALFDGNPPVTGGFPSQSPVKRRFDVFFYVRLNKRLNKQWSCRWFETPWYPCDVTVMHTFFTQGNKLCKSLHTYPQFTKVHTQIRITNHG